MITLYQFPPAFGLPNASPFCMKLETYLRMAGLSYEIAKKADVRKAPKRKLPYIVDNGKTIADSGLIIDYLKSTYGDKLDSHLSQEEHAIGLAFRRLMEENLYWAVLYTRWIENLGWEITQPVFFGSIPLPLRAAISKLVRKKIREALEAHGMGRHTREEIYKIGIDDINAISIFLADKFYFLGDKPSTLDATAYAFIANLLYPPYENALRKHAQSLPNLHAYCERMKQRYFGEDRRGRSQDLVWRL